MSAQPHFAGTQALGPRGPSCDKYPGSCLRDPGLHVRASLSRPDFSLVTPLPRGTLRPGREVGPSPGSVFRAQPGALLPPLPPWLLSLPDPAASVPASPAHRQDGDLALASGLGPGLGSPGRVGQESGGGSGSSRSLRGQQHLGPLLVTTGAAEARERGQALHGVEVVVMGTDVRHAGGAGRQPVEGAGGSGH